MNTKKDTGRCGLSLVEVMVAAVVAAGVLLAVLGSVLQAYRMDEEARRQDQVRAVLQSYVDDFLCAKVRDDSKAVQPFFKVSAAPTGVGLSWKDSAGTTVTGTAAGLTFALGGEGAPKVVITRWVREVDEGTTTGTPDFSAADKSAVGREIVGQFTATYTVNRRIRVVTFSTIRSDV
ncbi:MAG: hypothetical protein QM691_17170 [Opitutaceae bacterium]